MQCKEREGRRSEDETKEDTKPCKHRESGPKEKMKSVTKVERQRGDDQVKVDLATQRRSRENISRTKEPTNGMEQELNAAEDAGPYVKQQAKESQPGILMERRWGQKCVLDLLRE